MPTVDLSFGPLAYRDIGPSGPAVPVAVFVHGFLVDSTLWDPVAERLAAAGVRCVLPDWPLGSHRLPADPEAELSPAAVGRAVPELLEALDLNEAALVGNDTGGALCQLALAGDTSRIGALVLTNCDVFERFPPPLFAPLFRLARHRWAVWTLMQQVRFRAVRHSPLAYGMLLGRPRSAALTRGWVAPALADAAIRRDITRFARGLRGDELLDAAAWLARFDRPARLVWGTRDRSFTLESARRLAAALPRAELVEVPGLSTFVPIDRPDAVADAVLAAIGDSVSR